MKKVVAILFIMLFVLKLGGFFVVFKIQQQQIRREIKTDIKLGIPEDELAVITVNLENEYLLEWKNGNEFLYQGHMYDIVRQRKLDAVTTVYYCVNDVKEAILFATLDSIVKKSMEQKGKRNIALQYSNPFITFEKNQIYIYNDSLVPKKVSISSAYVKNYSSLSLNITGPPPKLT